MSALALLGNINVPVAQFVDVKVAGYTIHADTVWSTVLAGLIVVGMGLAVRRSATKEVPGRLQLFWEVVVEAVQGQVEGALGSRAAAAVPLAITLFVFILVANWLEVIPSGARTVALPAPAADVNFTYALALVVFLVYTTAGIRRLGLGGYLSKLAKPHWSMTPINLIEEIAKPFTLSLRLFGNLFSGGLMIALLALLPFWLTPIPTAAWKLFDMFIGVIQAFIFALLTVLYYEVAVSKGGH